MLKITTAQVVETSVTVNNNRLIQDYVHPDNHTQPTCFSQLVAERQLHLFFQFRALKLFTPTGDLTYSGQISSYSV